MNAPQNIKSHMFDTLANLLTGLGVVGRDKTVSTRYVFSPLTRQDLDNAYRGDWIARKAVDIPPLDSTREWRTWEADKKDISAIETEEKRLDLQRKVKRAMTLGRLYGGGALLIGAGDDDVTKELKPETIAKDGLRYVHAVSCNLLVANLLDRDVESEYFGEPQSYRLTSQTDVIADIHPSRVVKFVGNELPEPTIMTGINFGWGDSILQAVDDAVKGAGHVTQGMASLIQEAKLDIIKLPGLDEMVSTAESRDRFQSRMQFMNVMKSLFSVTLLDDRDTWDRKEITFNTGMSQLLEVYLMLTAGAVDVPMTRFLGVSPRGLNATGESDTRNYYDRIRSEQETDITPRMKVLDRCLIASALGSIPDQVWYEWRPLWAASDSETATITLQKAQAFKIDADAGLIPEEALREGRENQLIEDGVYPGLEQALEDAEAAQQAALNELDPEVRAQAEQQLAMKKAGVSPIAPPVPPGGAQGQPPGAGGRPNGSGGGQPSGAAPARLAPPRGAKDAIALTAIQARKRRLVNLQAKRGSKGARALYETGLIHAAWQITQARRRRPAGDADDAYNPDQPRVPAGEPGGGQWGSGGGGGVGGSEHPGKGYTAGAYVDEQGVIQTTSVFDAQRALAEGRRVELDQPSKVSVLIQQIGLDSARLIEQGKQAPNYNLCGVMSHGESLFCQGNKDVPRIKMPQLDKAQTKAFIQSLKDEGYKAKKDEIRADHMRATQNEISGAKAYAASQKMLAKSGGEIAKRLVVSRDNYVLDGHHHWVAKMGLDYQKGTLKGSNKIKVTRVDISITKLLEKANAFTGGKGAKGTGDNVDFPARQVGGKNRHGVRDLDWNPDDNFDWDPEDDFWFGDALAEAGMIESD